MSVQKKNLTFGNDPLLILLADDDLDDQIFFKQAFKEIGKQTTVLTVDDGVQLMNYLSETAVALPDILFLDLNMPRKNGLECLREIRSNPRLSNLSVAIYSTSASEHDIEETFVQGANVYIRKPDNFPSLVNILSEVIKINWQYHTNGLDKENFLLNL